MKLYEVPRNSWIRLVDTGEQFFFEHIDGMYSVCRNHANEIVHISANAEVATFAQPVGNPALERLKAQGYTEEDLEASNPHNQWMKDHP